MIGDMMATTSYLTSLLILYVVPAIACKRIFRKAGVARWRSRIPIYNLFVLYKVMGMSGWWTVPYYLTLLLSNILKRNPNMSQWFILCLLVIALISAIGQIKKAFRLPKAFGKGRLYSLVSVFFSRIVELIIAFGKSEYKGNYSESKEAT